MKKLGLASAVALLTGCTSISVQDYKDEKPVLHLEQYLNGRLDAYGFFQDRSGKIVKRFKVEMLATWKEGVGTLDEDFTYSDGTKSKRVWTLKKTADGKFVGRADDVIGEAFGETAGNAFQWKYTLDLPVDGTHYHVQFDDWMFLMEDNILLNKSKMYKFGIYLGEVTLTFVKR